MHLAGDFSKVLLKKFCNTVSVFLAILVENGEISNHLCIKKRQIDIFPTISQYRTSRMNSNLIKG